MKTPFLLFLFSLSLLAAVQSPLVEKAANEWAKEVEQASHRGAAAPYFIFRDLEIRSENSLLEAEAEARAAKTALDLAKDITNRKAKIFQERGLSKAELEKAELWTLKAEKELQKATLKQTRLLKLIEISRINRKEAVNGDDISEKLPGPYLLVWKMDCQIAEIDMEIAEADVVYDKNVKTRNEKLYKKNAVSGFAMLQSIADLKKAEQRLDGKTRVVKHCKALELIPNE